MLTSPYLPLHLFIVTQSVFFFALILFAPHGRRLAKVMLLAFIATQISSPVRASLSQYLEPGLFSTLVGSLYYLVYLAGPAFYFYIKALRSPEFCLDYRLLRHLLPVIIALGGVQLLQSLWVIPALLSFVLDSLAQAICLMCYLIAGLRLLPGYQWFLSDLWAPKDDVIWRWLIVPTVFYVAVYAVLVAGLVTQVALYPRAIDLSFAFNLIMTARIIFFYFVGIGAFRNREFYEKEGEHLSLEKYQTSALDKEALSTIWESVSDYMECHEPFCDTQLKLPQLAGQLDLPEHYLSQVINTCSGKSVPDYINSYRVSKAKVLLEQDTDRGKSMLDISLEAGFGNSGTFYKYFKKYFNITPAQYRKTCQNH